MDADRYREQVRSLYLDPEAYERLVREITFYRPRIEALLARVVRPGARVLDVGCGPGQFTRTLPDDVEVVGLDLSEEMIAAARVGRPSGIYQPHDYHEPIPARLKRFDLVLAVGCLEFCRDLPAVFANFAAATKPGGTVYVTVPERDPARAHHASASSPLAEGEKWRGFVSYFFSRDDVAAAAEAAGLKLVSWDSAPGWNNRNYDGGVVYQYGFAELVRPARKKRS